MTLPRPKQGERHILLNSALAPLVKTERDELFDLLDDLFDAALTADGLLHVDVDNPIEHHTTVLKQMMTIAKGEDYSFQEIRRAAVASLLHDIHPVPKVPREMREAAKTAEKRAQLELRNLENRIVHMGVGATRARQLLIELNIKRGVKVLPDDDADSICAIIAIHDVPSINLPIPKEARLAVAFREADRLWMQTRAGLEADWARKNVTNPSHEQLVEQSNRNLSTYRKEAGLYDPSVESFETDRFFFRTNTGKRLLRNLKQQW